jgi:hypothetical protein
LTPNESVEKALFWLFSNSQAFDFIDSEFAKNDFSYRLNEPVEKALFWLFLE